MIRVKELPVWSIFAFLATLIFTGGQLYAQQIELQKEMDALESKQELDVEKLRKQLEQLRSGQTSALGDLRVISTQIGTIEKILERLDERSREQYDSQNR